MSNNVFDKQLPLVIGSDHAGYEYKEIVKSYLLEDGWMVEDKGTYSLESTDYPDYAHPVATMVAEGKASVGILLCGSGNGVCITANKHAHIRAALCWNVEVAALSRMHNDANVLCIPARFTTQEEAIEMTRIFLSTAFEGGRHERRVEKIG
jgi:ribose 5-phosphate isomerase B